MSQASEKLKHPSISLNNSEQLVFLQVKCQEVVTE